MSALLWLFAAWTVAGASEEPWEDGLQSHVPRTAAAWTQGAYSPGPGRYTFADLGGSMPIWRNQRGNFGLGANVNLAGAHWAMPREGRSGLGMRSVTGEAWMWLGNPDKATTHAFGGGVGLRPGDTASYLLNPVESANRMYVAYDGYIDGGRVDFSWVLRAGPNDRTLLEMTGQVAMIVELNPTAALTLGLHTGIGPAYILPGVRGRIPLQGQGPSGLEVGLCAGLPTDVAMETFLPERTSLILNAKLYGFGRR